MQVHWSFMFRIGNNFTHIKSGIWQSHNCFEVVSEILKALGTFFSSKGSFSKQLLKIADLQQYFEILQKGEHIFSFFN